MASKKDILRKIRILITQNFQTAEEAFNFFDKNRDGNLSKKELKSLVKRAEINGFIAGIVANKMIQGLDKDHDEKLNWKEFKKALSNLLSEDQ